MMRAFLLACAVALFLSGCGSHAQKPIRPVGQKSYSAEEHKGSVGGFIAWEGDVPSRETIDVSRDTACAAFYKSSPLLNEKLVVQNGRVQNAVVYLSRGTEDWNYPLPAQAATMAVQQARFEPHVVAISAGQKLQFTNKDGFYHTVLSGARQVNPQFNLGLQPANPTKDWTFEYAEMGFPVTSDIRKWMSGRICIFFHPFHAVSGPDGSFELKNVPDGEYVLEVWHENPDVQTPGGEVIQVKAGRLEKTLTLKLRSKL